MSGRALGHPIALKLSTTAWLQHQSPWLEEDEALQLLERLRSDCVWEQRSIRLFGKEVMQPRLVAAGGSATYRYSGVTLPVRPMPGVVSELLDRVHNTLDQSEATRGWRANHALLNRYRDGSDSMGWHSDDERELGTNPIIVSVSVGARRRLDFAPRRPRSRPDAKVRAKTNFGLWLEHGDLLVMGGSTQHEWRHRVPRRVGVEAERVSVTFRRILPTNPS